jgi:hypothetical protein
MADQQASTSAAQARGSGVFAAEIPQGGEELPRPTIPGGPPRGYGGVVEAERLAVGAAGGAISFVDNGGPVISTAHVILIFWGAQWAGTTAPSMGAVTDAVNAILTGPYMNSLSQYRGIRAGTLFGSLLAATPVGGSPANPPNPFTNGDVEGLIQNLCNAGRVPAPATDSQLFYCVIMPPGVNQPGSGFIGEHTFFSIGGANAHYAWVTNSGTLPFVTTVFSHELVETVTDPEGSAILGTAGTCSQPGWCEIGDVCTGNTAVVNGVTVQRYWSNRDNACVVPTDKIVKDNKDAKDKDKDKDAKDHKDNKEIKDGAKDKETHKELKDGAKEKETDGFDLLTSMVTQLSDRLSAVERRIIEIAGDVQGRAFIRPEERPPVGEQALQDSGEEEPTDEQATKPPSRRRKS